jgi:hypothetical protein
MRLIVVESPYAGDIEGNTRYARLCLRDCLDRGEAPFASHLLYTQPHVLDDTVPRERDQGIQAGYSWMTIADCVAFYTDRGWSPGMLKALKMARILGRPHVTRSLDSRREYLADGVRV